MIGRLRAFVLFVGCAALFVWLTSRALPDLVAAHFDGSGAANGFMPRGFYIGFMLGFVIGLPTLLVFVTWHAIGRPNARLNLPNRDHWLAPQRRAETIGAVRTSLVWFGVLLLSFLCYAHGLVVIANEARPPRLDNALFIGGLVVFFVAVAIWMLVLLGRFSRSRQRE